MYTHLVVYSRLSLGVIQAGHNRQVTQKADIFAGGLCVDPNNGRAAFSVVQVLHGADKARRDGRFDAPCFAAYGLDSVYGTRGDESGRLGWILVTKVLCSFELVLWCLVPAAIPMLLNKTMIH